MPARRPRGRTLLWTALMTSSLALTGCSPTWTPGSEFKATEFNVPWGAQNDLKIARSREKSGDLAGARVDLADAAATGHPYALYTYARAMLKEPGRDSAKAAAALEGAVGPVSAWQANSAYLLGRLLARGDGVPQDDARARQLMEMAVQAGIPGSEGELARILERDPTADPARVEALLQKAADQGDERATVRLVDVKLARGVPRASMPGEVGAALAILNQGAAEGDPAAMRALARAYGQGTLVPADPDQEMAWLERAAKAGDAQSATRLATRLRGTGRDEERIALLRQGAEAGDVRAQAGLARAYLEGDGVPMDRGEALHWGGLAMNAGDTATMTLFGKAYLDGDQLPKDVARATTLLTRAADGGDARAAAALARLYLRAEDVAPDPVLARRYADQAIAAGDVPTMTALGRALVDGKTMPADPAAGVALLQRSAATGDPIAKTQLGIAYLDGVGTPVDKRRAFQLLLDGAKAKQPSAMNRLAGMLLGDDAAYRDVPTGIGMLKAAAAAGHPSAQAELGKRLLNGQDIAQDQPQGLALLRKAAAAGHASAMLNLGRAYLDGNGVPEDARLAREWLVKAKEAGRDDADRYLARLPDA